MNTAEMAYIHNGENLAVDPAACTGCGLCLEVCPHNVLELRPAAGRRVATVLRPEFCMACGACKMNCPAKAISVESGVGCVAAIIQGMLTGKEPSCGCDEEASGKKGGACCG